MNKIKLKNVYGETIKITLVDNQNKANFITHSGTFHADEIMATCILLNKFGNLKMCRTNNVTNKDVFVYDIGFGKYDHHAIDFDETRDNGIKYASAGLVWKEFGKDILKCLGVKDVDSAFESVDKNLILDIDRDDNGQALKNDPEIKQQNIPSIVGNFNPAWNDLSNENECFLNALSVVNNIFNNIIKNIVAKEEAKSIVEEQIKKSENGILIMDKYMPWKDIVLSSEEEKAKEILYAVFPSKRGGYNVVAVPKSAGSFEIKKAFPKAWAGLENEELQKVSEIKTITFCHKNLFICACGTYDDALLIAKTAIENKE